MRSTEKPCSINFIPTANEILVAPDSKAIDNLAKSIANAKAEIEAKALAEAKALEEAKVVVTEKTMTKAKSGKKAKPATKAKVDVAVKAAPEPPMPKSQSDIERLDALLLLCDIRRVMIGDGLNSKNKAVHVAMRQRFLNADKKTTAEESFGWTLRHVVAITSHILLDECNLDAISNIINRAFQIQLIAISVRESVLPTAQSISHCFEIILQDKAPNNEYEKCLYELLKAVFKKLFELRALLMEQRRELQDAKQNTFICDDNIAMVDAILRHFNLHEYPECRAKYAAHHAAQKVSDLAYGVYYTPGVYSDLRELFAYEEAVQTMRFNFKRLVTIYANRVIITGTDIDLETQIYTLMKSSIKLLNQDLQVLLLYRGRHAGETDAGHHLEMMGCFLDVLRWEFDISEKLTLTNYFRNIKFNDYCEYQYKYLLHARPEILLSLQPNSPLKVFADMRVELLQLIAGHQQLKNNKRQHAEMVMANYITCLFNAKEMAEKVLISQIAILSARLADDLHPHNRKMYEVILLMTISPQVATNNGYKLFVDCKRKIENLFDSESRVDAVILQRFLEHAATFIGMVKQFGTLEQIQEADQYLVLIDLYKKYAVSEGLSWCQKVEKVKNELQLTQLEIADFSQSLSKKTAARVMARLVKSTEIPDHDQPESIPVSFTVAESAPSAIVVESLFCLAVKVMRASSLVEVRDHSKIYQELINLKASDPDVENYVTKIKKMLKVLIVNRSLAFGYHFENIKYDQYDQLVQELCANSPYTTEPNVLQIIDLYIHLAAAVLDLIKADKAELVLRQARHILAIIYQMQRVVIKVDCTSQTYFDSEFAEKMISAFKALTGCAPSNNPFHLFFDELVSLIYLKLGSTYSEIVALRAETLPALKNQQREVGKIDEASTLDIVGRSTVISCNTDLEVIEQILARLGLLDNLQKNFPHLSVRPPSSPITDSTAFFTRYSIMINKLADLSYAYGNLKIIARQSAVYDRNLLILLDAVYGTDVAAFLSEVDIFYIDLCNAAKRTSDLHQDKLELEHLLINLNLFRLIANYYHYDHQNAFLVTFVDEVVAFEVESILFDVHFTRELSHAAIDMLQRRMEFIFNAIDDRAQRLEIVKSLAAGMAKLLTNVEQCPDKQKNIANEFAINYFILCMQAAVWQDERKEFTASLIKVMSLITEVDHKVFFKLILKFFSAKYGDISYAELFRETFDFVKLFTVDFTKDYLKLSHHKQNFYALLNGFDIAITFQGESLQSRADKMLFLINHINVFHQRKVDFSNEYIKARTLLPVAKIESHKKNTNTPASKDTVMATSNKSAKRNAKLRLKKQTARETAKVADALELTAVELVVETVVEAVNEVEPPIEPRVEAVVIRDINPQRDLIVQLVEIEERVPAPEPRPTVVNELFVIRTMKPTKENWFTKIFRPLKPVQAVTDVTQTSLRAAHVRLRKPHYLMDVTTKSIFNKLGVTTPNLEMLETREVEEFIFSELHHRFISALSALNIPVYAYDGYVCDAIFKLRPHSLSLLCLTEVSVVLAILNHPENKPIFGIDEAIYHKDEKCIKILFNRELLAKLDIPYTRSDLNMTITCHANTNINAVINEMCASHPLNSRLFYDVRSSTVIARARYFNELVVYPVFNINPACLVAPRLDIAAPHPRIANPGKLILESIVKLSRYHGLAIGVGHNLNQFIQTYRDLLRRPDQRYTQELFDELFISGYARLAYHNLAGTYVLQELFPMISQDLLTDLFHACSVTDGYLEQHSYDDLTCEQLLKLRAKFIALSFYHTFIANRDYLEYLNLYKASTYLKHVDFFLNHLPFDFSGPNYNVLCREVAVLFYKYLYKDKVPALYEHFMHTNHQPHYRNSDAARFKANVKATMPQFDADTAGALANTLWKHHMKVLHSRLPVRTVTPKPL